MYIYIIYMYILFIAANKLFNCKKMSSKSFFFVLQHLKCVYLTFSVGLSYVCTYIQTIYIFIYIYISFILITTYNN